MTQAILNQNNLDILTNSQKEICEKISVVKTQVEDKTSSVNDFDKIFDKQITKENEIAENKINFTKNSETSLNNSEQQQNSLQVLTLGDLKKFNTDTNIESLWNEFREVLAETVDDANIQTSLDLTLAKDIIKTIENIKKDDLSNTSEIIDEKDIEDVDESVANSGLLQDSELYAEIDSELNLESSEAMQNEINQTNVDIEQVIALIKQQNSETEQSIDFNKNINSESDFTIELSDDTLFQASDSSIEMNASESLVTQNKTTEQDLNLILDDEMLNELNVESIESETNFENQDSLMNQQSPEEQGIKIALHKDIDFVENLEIKLEKSPVNTSLESKTVATEINPSKIIEQISKQLEGLQNSSKVNIVLNPESLGKVSIQLIKTGEGLSAQFTVNSQEVRDMLMKGLDNLRDSLLTQGVSVDNVTVKIENSQKTEYSNNWTEQDGSRGGNKEQKNPDKDNKDKELFEKMMAQTTEDKNENGKV